MSRLVLPSRNKAFAHTFRVTLPPLPAPQCDFYFSISLPSQTFLLKKCIFNLWMLNNAGGAAVNLNPYTQVSQEYSLKLEPEPITLQNNYVFDSIAEVGAAVTTISQTSHYIFFPGTYEYDNYRYTDQIRAHYIHINRDAAITYSVTFGIYIEVETIDIS